MRDYEFGEYIYNLRKQKGLSQAELGALVGVSNKAVSKWETGHGFPDVSTISTLADVLGVSERILLSGNLPQIKQDVGNFKNMKFTYKIT